MSAEATPTSKRHKCRRILFYIFLLAAPGSMLVYLWPPNYDQLIKIVGPDGKLGYIDSGGRVVVEPVWDDIDIFDSEGMAAVIRDEKYGWVDRRGKVVISPEWHRAESFGGGELARVFDGEHFGWIDRQGKVVVEPEWTWSDRFDAAGMAAVTKKPGYWGWISREGNMIIPPTWTLQSRDSLVYQYDPGDQFKTNSVAMEFTPPVDESVRAFDSEGFVRVKAVGKWGWMDRSGALVIEPFWDSARDFDSEGMAAVEKDGRWGWIDRTGKTVIPIKWYYAFSFDDHGMACVCHINNWGWIDRSGTIVIPARWDQGKSHASLNQLPRSIRGSYYDGDQVLDLNNAFQFDPNGLAMVGRDLRWGWINRLGDEVIPAEWDQISAFDESGMAQVEKAGLAGWINIKGEVVIPVKEKLYHTQSKRFAFVPPGDFDEHGMAKTYREKKWGWIDREGREVIPNRYQYATNFDPNGLAFVIESPVGELPSSLEQITPEWTTGVGAWIDRTGRTVISLPGSNWRWQEELRQKPDMFSLNPIPEAEMKAKRHGYVASNPEQERTWLTMQYLKTVNWISGDKSEVPETEVGCVVYNPNGKMIWSSRWVDFETKCLLVFVLALIAAVLTNPRRSKGDGRI